MRLVGYIVNCSGYGPMLLENGHLYFGNHVTLFKSRQQAHNAIAATLKDRMAQFGTEFEVDFGELVIKRVRP